MSSATVRIPLEDRTILRQLMARTGASAGEILHQAIEDYRRKCFLEEANRAFAELKRDPRAWKAELKERKAWETTLRDGLKDK
jgi:hypothetical protein